MSFSSTAIAGKDPISPAYARTLDIKTQEISGLNAVVVCFNPKFGAGRFGPAENEHFLKAANLAVQKKVDMWIVIYQSSGIDVHTGLIGLAGGMTKSIIAMDKIKDQLNEISVNICNKILRLNIYGAGLAITRMNNALKIPAVFP